MLYWDTYLLTFCSLPQLVDEFSYCHENGEHQARCQHNEYTTQILDTHGACLSTLLIQTAAPTPPLLFQHVEAPILQDA